MGGMAEMTGPSPAQFADVCLVQVDVAMAEKRYANPIRFFRYF